MRKKTCIFSCCQIKSSFFFLVVVGVVILTVTNRHCIVLGEEEDIDDEDDYRHYNNNIDTEYDKLFSKLLKIDMGVQQNLDPSILFGDDEDDDGLSISKQDVMNHIIGTQKYIQTEVMNILNPEQVERCKDYHENCAIWSLNDQCEENTEYMEISCAASCRVCHTVLPDEDNCWYVENGPNAWNANASHLHHMFENIVNNPYYQQHYNIQILSSPNETKYDPENGDPWIIIIDDFLTDIECTRLIELGALEGYEHSTLEEEGLDGSWRTSSNSWCEEDKCVKDQVTIDVFQRITNMTNISYEYTENMQMLQYHTGQFYKKHHDAYDLSEEDEAQMGHRILTVFLYLNDIEAGGGTTFPDLNNLTVVPKKGRALLWPSVLDSNPTEIDWRMEHEANIVEQGMKYGANVWFRLKPIRNAFTRYQCRQCTYLENGPDIWQPGDLDKNFHRIADDRNYREMYNTQVLSSPVSSLHSPNTDVASDPVDGPWIIMMDNFITVDEAQRLTELGNLESYEESGLEREGVDEYWRTSTHSWCEDECSKDETARSVLQRIYSLVQIREDYSEKMQMVKYEEGQFYKAHSDYIDLDQDDVEQYGDRILTFYIYLNDVKEGGHTSFPVLNLTVTPKLGRVLIWPSVLNNNPYEIDWRTEHEAHPVRNGEKYGANVWFRLKPFRLAYSKKKCNDENDTKNEEDDNSDDDDENDEKEDDDDDDDDDDGLDEENDEDRNRHNEL